MKKRPVTSYDRTPVAAAALGRRLPIESDFPVVNIPKTRVLRKSTLTIKRERMTGSQIRSSETKLIPILLGARNRPVIINDVEGARCGCLDGRQGRACNVLQIDIT